MALDLSHRTANAETAAGAALSVSAGPPADDSGPAGAGLVKSAITGPTRSGRSFSRARASGETAVRGYSGAAPLGPEVPRDLDGALRDLVAEQQQLAFPSAALVGAAAATFPSDTRGAAGTEWSVVADWGATRSWAEHHTLHEGVYPRLEVAPGLLRFTRANPAQSERTGDAARDMAARTSKGDLSAGEAWWIRNTPRDEDDPDDDPVWSECGDVAVRGVVLNWSRKSRARLRARVASLDLEPMLSRGTPVMLTLTCPGLWLDVVPTAAHAADAFNRFCRAYAKRWGHALQCIWKREFQRRGAPHWHLWMVPPVDLRSFREWASAAWVVALQVPEVYGPHRAVMIPPREGIGPAYADYRRCTCSERCRALLAGTAVDQAEGMRSRDPRRLAAYFLKESGTGASKAYQNVAPWEWGGYQPLLAADDDADGIVEGPLQYIPASVGRFWGVRGLDTAVESVDLPVHEQYRTWRILRGIRDRRDVRWEEFWWTRSDPVTGKVRRRRIHRRVGRVKQRAGWVALNDGPAVAAQIGLDLSRRREADEPLRRFRVWVSDLMDTAGRGVPMPDRPDLAALVAGRRAMGVGVREFVAYLRELEAPHVPGRVAAEAASRVFYERAAGLR